MFTLKHEGNILFFDTNQSPPGADSEIVWTQADQWSWARAPGPSQPLCFFLVVGAALGQHDATTPRQTEKELEIKKKEVKPELDLQKKRAELEKLKVALKYQETAHAININLQADVLFDLGKAEIRPEAEAALDKVGAVIQQFPNSKVWIDGYTDSIGSQNIEERSARKKQLAAAFKPLSKCRSVLALAPLLDARANF
jgi:flagellar motor protein MotB